MDSWVDSRQLFLSASTELVTTLRTRRHVRDSRAYVNSDGLLLMTNMIASDNIRERKRQRLPPSVVSVSHHWPVRPSVLLDADRFQLMTNMTPSDSSRGRGAKGVFLEAYHTDTFFTVIWSKWTFIRSKTCSRGVEKSPLMPVRWK